MMGAVDVLARLLDEMGNREHDDVGLFTPHGQAVWLVARGVSVAYGSLPKEPESPLCPKCGQPYHPEHEESVLSLKGRETHEPLD